MAPEIEMKIPARPEYQRLNWCNKKKHQFLTEHKTHTLLPFWLKTTRSFHLSNRPLKTPAGDSLYPGRLCFDEVVTAGGGIDPLAQINYLTSVWPILLR